MAHGAQMALKKQSNGGVEVAIHGVMGGQGTNAGEAGGEHGVYDGAADRGHRLHAVKMVCCHRAGVERQEAKPQDECALRQQRDRVRRHQALVDA